MSVLLTHRIRQLGSSSRTAETRAASPSTAGTKPADTKALPSTTTLSVKAPERPTAPARASSSKADTSSSVAQALPDEHGTPPPPPLSQIPKRPVRSTRSQAPLEDPVEEVKPVRPKKTRTAKHPRVNSKKIVGRLQEEWAARIAALPASFRGEGPPPPLNAAQVNSLREEQEIQVRY